MESKPDPFAKTDSVMKAQLKEYVSVYVYPHCKFPLCEEMNRIICRQCRSSAIAGDSPSKSRNEDEDGGDDDIVMEEQLAYEKEFEDKYHKEVTKIILSLRDKSVQCAKNHVKGKILHNSFSLFQSNKMIFRVFFLIS